jgi:outer membrane protein assembly factor BamB
MREMLYDRITKRSRRKRSGVRRVTSSTGARTGRMILLGFFSLLLAGMMSSGSTIGYGQVSVANLFVQSIELQPRGFFIEAPGPPITIRAILGNNGSLDAPNFDVSMRIRREDEPTFRSDERCQFVGTFSSCTNLSLRVGESAVAIGVLPTSNLTIGRYIIRVAIDPKGTLQSSQADDAQEALLLIGIVLPEFHPTSLTFTPPSPVPRGVQLTVKVQIENTGRPIAPELQVRFEHCLESPTCIEFSTQGFPQEGIRRLTPDQTSLLAQGRPLEVSHTLDTTDLQIGRYIVRATILRVLDAVGNQLDELDKSNGEITTRLTLAPPGLGGLNPPLCQLSGNVITLGRGVGTVSNRPVPVIYVGARDAQGRVSLHAFKKSDVDQAQPESVCREIDNSPLSLPADISSFAIDEKVKLLHVGLSNGQLIAVDLDSPEKLTATSARTVATAALQTLAVRLAGRNAGEVYLGARDGNLYRVRVTKGPTGLNVASSETCARVGSPINSVLIFQGNVYFGANNGEVRRIPDGSCSQSQVTTFFKAGRAVKTLATNQLLFGRIPAPQVLAGLEDGKLHVLNIFGQNFVGSPLALTQGAAITALAVNERDKIAYVGTTVGSVHAIDLNSRMSLCPTPFSARTLQAINVLAVDDGGQEDLPGSGLVFAGSDDNHLYVISSKTCSLVTNPQSTLGPIRAGMVLDGVTGFFGFEGVSALYGGGSGLFRLTIPLSAVP